MMAPDSIMVRPVSRSRIAGILPFGLISRNAGTNCSPLPMSTGCTSYAQPNSSRAIDALRPFAVPQVYRSITAARSSSIRRKARMLSHRAGAPGQAPGLFMRSHRMNWRGRCPCMRSGQCTYSTGGHSDSARARWVEMTTAEGNAGKGTPRRQDESRFQWSRFLNRAIRRGNLEGLEAAVWAAAARYAEWPSRDRERELKRAAQAFGIDTATFGPRRKLTPEPDRLATPAGSDLEYRGAGPAIAGRTNRSPALWNHALSSVSNRGHAGVPLWSAGVRSAQGTRSTGASGMRRAPLGTAAVSAIRSASRCRP